MNEQKVKTRADYPMALETKHVKEIMGIGERQAYELMASGKFHVVRAGRMYKVANSVFFDWLEGK